MSTTSSSSRPAEGLFRRALRRWWLPMLAVWLLGSAAVMGTSLARSRPTYRAVSLIRVDPAPDGLYGIRTSGDDIGSHLETQVRLVTSSTVLNAAASNPKVSGLARIKESKDVVDELRSAIKVGVVPQTYLIEVSMNSPDPQEAASLVNAVVDASAQANGEWADGMTRSQIKNLEGYKVDLENQVLETERRWKDLVGQGGHGNEPPVANRAGITIEEYKRVRKDLLTVNMELAEAQAWLTAAKAAFNKAGKNPSPAAEEERLSQQIERRFRLDPEVVDLAGQMKQARQKLEEVRRIGAEPGDPAERAAERKLSSLKSRYNELWEAKSLAIREQIELGAGHGIDPEQEIREAETKVKQLLSRQSSLSQFSKELEVTNKRQAPDPVEISLIIDQRNSLKEMIEAVTRRLEQLRFESRGGARIRAVDKARPPGKPIGRESPHPILFSLIPFAMLIPAFGLFAGIEAWLGPRARREEVKPGTVEPPAEV